jgi:hypothetical protein
MLTKKIGQPLIRIGQDVLVFVYDVSGLLAAH